ncbi:protein of unknown function [Ruminococcaceae bacterium KH2T8]|nr:protein of unknown function [Ruminococcaceae bacterium KH2T8]
MTVDAYAWFIVKSAGEFSSESGYVSYPDGIFDPEDFTACVMQEPRESWKFGDKRTSAISPKIRETTYPSSSWLSERVEAEGEDVVDICDRLVERFEPYVDEIREFKSKYHVFTEIEVVLYKMGLESNGPFFTSRVIDFCSETGTEISVNTMLASTEGEDK